LLHQQGIDVMGATSSGEFIDGHQSQGETAIMLLNLNKNDYCILFEAIGERSLTDATIHLSHAALQKFSNPAFILCSTLLSADGKMVDGETLVRSIEKTIGPQVMI